LTKTFSSPATIADSKAAGSPLAYAKAGYFYLVLVSVVVVAIASFVRERGHLLSNISFWVFLVPFVATLWRTRVGLLAAAFLLTVAPSLHEQVFAMTGVKLHVWAYPGVDSCLGFLTAWTVRREAGRARVLLNLFPSGTLLLFHAWVTFSAVLVSVRNVWQSASELSLRGLVYNVWLTRGISWHDDYYPLQDPFFYSVALLMLFATWSLLQDHGDRLLRRLIGVVLIGAGSNVAFVLWQKLTGKGWVNGSLATNVNAFWPDLHSFAVFMAMALFLACGLLVQRSSGQSAKAFAGLAMVAAAIGIYFSGSRSTLFFVLVLLVGWALWWALRSRGWSRVIALITAVAVIGVVHLILEHGYREMSYALVRDRLQVLDANSINRALSHRPEIWAAAVRMYAAFPFFGLGQGAFYRQSAVADFSESAFLVEMIGEGVHNEFLRLLVELGPVGVALLLFIAIPFIRLGRKNFQWVSFYALVGIALGSVYTNALLVRELLVLSGIFVGCYLWEVHAAKSPQWHPRMSWATRHAVGVLAVLVLAALIEFATSFGRFPFVYAQRCHHIRPLTSDGWTEGVLRVPIPPAAERAEVVVVADRPDLDRRPVSLDLSVLAEGGASLATVRHTFVTRENVDRKFELTSPESVTGKRFLELKPSSCYVPLNLGVTYDPRRLGIRVNKVRFTTAGGTETQ